MAPTDDLITTSEAAELLGVTVRTVQRWCASGLLAHRQIGRDLLVFRARAVELRDELELPAGGAS